MWACRRRNACERKVGVGVVPVVVLDVVGLTPALLAHMPRVSAVGARGFQAPVGTVLPPVRPTTQVTFMTGTPPGIHGIIGSAWYERESGGVIWGREQYALVQQEPFWASVRRREPEYRVASLYWSHGIGAETDLTVTAWPAGTRGEAPGVYVAPDLLRCRLEAEFGPSPLAPEPSVGADETTSRWIAGAAGHVLAADEPDLTLVCLPYLARQLVRHGPGTPAAAAAAGVMDELAGAVIAAAYGRGAVVVVLSGFGVTPIRHQVPVNLALHRAGLARLQTYKGSAQVDPWASDAFALTDHQVAHVYVRDPADLSRTRAVLTAQHGVTDVLEAGDRDRIGLDHPRAGDLVVLAASGAWCRGRLEEDRAVAGMHGLPPASPGGGPVLLCSEPGLARDRVAATQVADLVLAAAGRS